MILVSLGANLPAPDGSPPLQIAQQAISWLDTLPNLRVQRVSGWYLTEPVPPSGQPPYVNAVALLQVERGTAEPDPAALLDWLQALEARAGRVRTEPNAARTLDLDIIAMGEAGDMVRTAADPQLPHPRAHIRGFVLVPLLDVAPDWVHPVLRRAARDLLQDLPPQGVQPISSAELSSGGRSGRR